MKASLPYIAATAFAAALAWGIWHYGATETWELYRLFLLAAASVLLIGWALPAGSASGSPPRPLVLVGCFLFAQIWLQPTLQGRGYVLAALGWMALFLSFRLASWHRMGARGLLFFLVLAGGFEALYGLAQTLGEPPAAGDMVRAAGATGTFINRNHFAGMLNMTLPLALGVLFTTYQRRSSRRSPRSETWAWSWVAILSCSVMGLAVLLSLSRGGVLTLAATLVFMACVLAFRRKVSHRGLPTLGVVLLILIILGLGLAIGLDDLSERFTALAQGREGRSTVYADSLRLIRDHAAFGVGPGMYRWRFRPYQTTAPQTRYDHAHNDYLETAADWGVPTAALFWAFVGWRLQRACRVFFESQNAFQQGLALGCSGALFSILLHSLIDFNLQIPTNLMIFCTILGLAWSLELQRHDAEAAPGRARA